MIVEEPPICDSSTHPVRDNTFDDCRMNHESRFFVQSAEIRASQIYEGGLAAKNELRNVACHGEVQHPPSNSISWISERLELERRFLEGLFEERYESLARDIHSFCLMTGTSDAACGKEVDSAPLSATSSVTTRASVIQNSPPGRKSIVNTPFVELNNDPELTQRIHDRLTVALKQSNDAEKQIKITQLSKAVDLTVSRSSSSVSKKPEDVAGSMSLQFEFLFGGLIVFNALVMAVWRQYESHDIGQELSFAGTRSKEEEWPGAGTVLEISEVVIGLLFCVELVCRCASGRLKIFKSLWTYFDILVVGFWVLGLAREMTFKPMLVRLCKLVRLARLLRIIRFIGFFDPLHLLIKSVASSVLILMWSLLLLLLIILVVAMAMSQSLDSYFLDRSVPLEERTAVFAQWGSMSRAVTTVFEITLGNWGPPCRLLQDNVSEWSVLFFLGYKSLIGFAVVQVITSVFIQQTFKTAQRDEQVMINEKKAQSAAYLRNLDHLFQVLDESGDGILTFEELALCISEPTVKAWFQAIDVNITEASHLFCLLDIDEDGTLSRDEFISGIKQLRGPASSIDMMCVMKTLRQIDNRIQGHVRTAPEPRLMHDVKGYLSGPAPILKPKRAQEPEPNLSPLSGGDGGMGSELPPVLVVVDDEVQYPLLSSPRRDDKSRERDPHITDDRPVQVPRASEDGILEPEQQLAPGSLDRVVRKPLPLLQPCLGDGRHVVITTL
eukprot:TRINITY_DN24651_c0_g1_i1.p1 TRINITY_DN24651_c0_g1~~TRINITY_DN24651_c0_g1_i1.p1  ORF type:complete len:724 (-),score=74.27 TRINITY_DN24651_c0_g1_i1:53-2224(-)